MTVSLKQIFRKFSDLIFGSSSDEYKDFENQIFGQEEDNEPIVSPNYTEEIRESLYVAPLQCDIQYTQSDCKLSDSTYDQQPVESEECLNTSETISKHQDEKDESNEDTSTNTIIEDLANLISEMDIIKARLDSLESKDIIQFCQERIIECISRQSLEEIGTDTVFNSERHYPQPFRIVPNGTLIKKYIRHGLKKDERIILKAIVEV